MLKKNFLIDCSLFLVVFLVLNFTFTNQFYLPITHGLLEEIDQNFLENHKNKSIFVFGDSHEREGLKFSNESHVFNYSLSAQNYWQDYHRLKSILERGDTEVKVIVLPFEEHNFYRSISDSVYLNYWSNQISLSDLSDGLGSNYMPFLSRLVIYKVLYYFNGLKHLLDKVHEPFKVNLENEFTEEKLLERISKRFDGKQFNQEMVYFFEKTLQLAYKYEITVVLLHTPVTRVYYNYLDKKYIEKFTDYKDHVFKNYRMIYIDYKKLNFPNNRKISQYFADFDHLNVNGQAYFSKMLEKQLEEIASR